MGESASAWPSSASAVSAGESSLPSLGLKRGGRMELWRPSGIVGGATSGGVSVQRVLGSIPSLRTRSA